MRLSEAIRLGSLLKPQGHEFLIHEGHTCAIGAAADAAGLLPLTRHMYPPPAVVAAFPLLNDYLDRACPVCLVFRLGVSSLVIHLNDAHNWTREQIADWVETLEVAASSSSVLTPAVEESSLVAAWFPQ